MQTRLIDSNTGRISAVRAVSSVTIFSPKTDAIRRGRIEARQCALRSVSHGRLRALAAR